MPDLTDEWKAELALKLRKSRRLNRERRAEATSEPDRPERESQERVDERRSPIRGWSVKTSVEALSFQTNNLGLR